MKNKKTNLGTKITLEDVKIIQMDILTAIDKFCKDHNIRYSLACGTLLGAIRHKGYIPWDDDIDIYMPREDYIRMMKEFPETYEGRYKIASLEREPLWDRLFAKAYDNTTLLIENACVNKHIGVCIDIFPIDDVPDNDQKWHSYNFWRKLHLNLLKTKYNSLNGNQSPIHKLAIALIQVLTCWYPKRKWIDYLDKLAQRNNNKGYSRCFECCQGLFQNKPFPKNLFDEIIDVVFEDRQFKAFANADTYLRNAYGNYMELPPENKRITIHDWEAYYK